MLPPTGHRLPFRTRPHGDELFTSWLARLAAHNGLSSQQFVAVVGGLSRMFQMDLDIEPPIELVERLASAASLDRRDIERLCITASEQRWIIPMGLAFRPKVRHGLQICPECLSSEHAYYRRVWRLSWYAACPHHYRLLLDRCRCGAAIGPLVSRVERINGVPDFCLCRSCGTDFRMLGGEPVNLIALGDVLALQHACWGDDARVLKSVGVLSTRLLEGRKAALLRRYALRACGLTAMASVMAREMGFVWQPVGARFALLAIAARWLQDWPNSIRAAFAAVRLSSEELEQRWT